MTFPSMEVFEFVIILVIITTLGKVLMTVGVPMVNRLADLVRELAAGNRTDVDAAGKGVEPELLEEIENRLARIEDRLAFLEELKAPDRRRVIGGRPVGQHEEGRAVEKSHARGPRSTAGGGA